MIFNMISPGNSGGGGISVYDIAQNLEPSGDIVLSNDVTTIGDYAFAGKPITSITAPSVTRFNMYSFQNTQITNITDANFPLIGVNNDYPIILRMNSLVSIKLTGEHLSLANGTGAFNGNTSLVSAEFPNAARNVYSSSHYGLGNSAFSGCTNLELLDLGYVRLSSPNCIYNCRKLTKLILRYPNVFTLQNIGHFNNSPFRGYNGLTGTAYVPSALIESYKTETNWATLYNNGTCNFVAIEGSIYEL